MYSDKEFEIYARDYEQQAHKLAQGRSNSTSVSATVVNIIIWIALSTIATIIF